MTDSTPEVRLPHVDTITTMTGMTLREALRKMQELLPPDAYKAVPGGASLTDIGPEYLTDVATQVFGPAGLGWRYTYSVEDLQLTERTDITKNGNERHVHEALLLRFELQYLVIDVDGTPTWSSPILSNGASESDNKGYAVRGAITNALGAVFAKLLWQLPVYKGQVTHQNAAELWKKKQARLKAATGGNGQKPVEAEKKPEAPTVSQPTPAPEPEAKKQAPALQPELAPLPLEHDLAWAKAFIIPKETGLPFNERTMGDALDNSLGRATIQFLSGEYPRSNGAFFEAANAVLKEAQEAAKIILNEVPGVRPQPKAKTSGK